jgi:hypothetical protein
MKAMRVAFLQNSLELDSEAVRLTPVSRIHRGTDLHQTGQPPNLGDWLIIQTTMEVLEAEAVYTLHPDHTSADIDLINAECDLLLLKGGNFVHRGWLEANLPLDLLKRFRIPIVYMGSGIQMPLDSEDAALTPGDVAVLRYIHDSTTSCMVRGHFTAEQLARHGITNVRVAGCPSLFASRRPTIEVRRPHLDRVAWTFRHGLFAEGSELMKAQLEALRRLRDKASHTVVLLQGEEIHLQRLYGFSHWRATTVNRRILIGNVTVSETVPVSGRELIEAYLAEYRRFCDDEMLSWLPRNMFFSFDLEDYRVLARDLGLVAGCRLHGNLLALSQGIPVVYFLYDRRVSELTELMRVPALRLDWGELDIDPDALDYRPFEARYAVLFEQYRTFLDENGIRHRLPLA